MQHERAQQLLQAREFEVMTLLLMILLVTLSGATLTLIGTVSKSALTALGFDKPNPKRLLYDLHAHAM